MATTYEHIAAVAAFHFDNSFARELQGFYVPQRPAIVREPRLLFLNDSLAAELGLDLNALDAGARAAVFAGNTLPDGAEPLAQAYAGHQFGGFVPQLGGAGQIPCSSPEVARRTRCSAECEHDHR